MYSIRLFTNEQEVSMTGSYPDLYLYLYHVLQQAYDTFVLCKYAKVLAITYMK